MIGGIQTGIIQQIEHIFSLTKINKIYQLNRWMPHKNHQNQHRLHKSSEMEDFFVGYDLLGSKSSSVISPDI